MREKIGLSSKMGHFKKSEKMALLYRRYQKNVFFAIFVKTICQYFVKIIRVFEHEMVSSRTFFGNVRNDIFPYLNVRTIVRIAYAILLSFDLDWN